MKKKFCFTPLRNVTVPTMHIMPYSTKQNKNKTIINMLQYFTEIHCYNDNNITNPVQQAIYVFLPILKPTITSVQAVIKLTVACWQSFPASAASVLLCMLLSFVGPHSASVLFLSK